VIDGQSTPEAFNVFVSYISAAPVAIPPLLESDVARLASELGCTTLELQVQQCKKQSLPNASNHDAIAGRLPDLLQSNPELFVNIPIEDIDKIIRSSSRARTDPVAENLVFDLIWRLVDKHGDTAKPLFTLLALWLLRRESDKPDTKTVADLLTPGFLPPNCLFPLSGIRQLYRKARDAPASLDAACREAEAKARGQREQIEAMKAEWTAAHAT
jgi:hypothetical protein